MRRTGHCLCGAASFEAEVMPRMQACHCSMCRKWGGGPYMAVPSTDAVFSGPVTRYASSEGVERGFCATCGTHLFFHHIPTPIWGIPAGLFDDASGLPFKLEIFIDDKPDSYEFANETRKMTGAEFMARFRSG